MYKNRNRKSSMKIRNIKKRVHAHLDVTAICKKNCITYDDIPQLDSEQKRKMEGKITKKHFSHYLT